MYGFRGSRMRNTYHQAGSNLTKSRGPLSTGLSGRAKARETIPRLELGGLHRFRV